jgi:3-methyladenine DNA glycosylase AlkD
VASVDEIVYQIRRHGSAETAAQCQIFFQTQPGGYGFGDKFCGVNVPTLRKIAAANENISPEHLEKLLQNELHEARFVALVLLVEKFKISEKQCLGLYLKNTKFINNWDLVDVSADKICGAHCLASGSSDILWKLAKSNDLWENRIAIVASLAFIRDNKLQLTLDLCNHFLKHEHHLIHKACGWMLRELGKRNENLLIEFIDEHKLPGIMKSYALEIIKKRGNLHGKGTGKSCGSDRMTQN